MINRSLFLLAITIKSLTMPAQSQAVKTTVSATAKPKLVVGIVVDQMRWDYLYRFYDLYGNAGFKRMLNQGFSCENALIPYMPTYTAAGHACVYTGSVPAIHGIMGNNWYDKVGKRSVYCTEDSSVSTVGTTGDAGKMSPLNMWTTTVTDELRLSNNFKSKVIGIAIKDRGSILPAGHSANAAYWYEGKTGKWITSSYYMKALPEWVNKFNAKDLVSDYMKTDWNTLLPISKYDLSSADDKPYERAIPGEKTVTFPHRLSTMTTEKYSSFPYTPGAATFTFDFAKQAIENEQLGASGVTDFLAISISSTDYIGHSFGPNSIEVEDSYLRLDKDLGDLFTYLDTKYGAGNYLSFLTADHAVAHTPAFLKEHNLPGGVFSMGDIVKTANQKIEEKFGVKSGILSAQNYQVYLNTSEFEKAGKNVAEVANFVVSFLKQQPLVVEAVSFHNFGSSTLPAPQNDMYINGFNPQRGGDILFTIKPGYFEGSDKGTTHGSWNPYDSHIPMVFFGWNVKPGKTNRETYMTDIAPTVAAMLQIQMPSGSVGKVVTEITSQK
ncbi:MAG: alkaline phosphatase PafA [Bacteroidota bacterium]